MLEKCLESGINSNHRCELWQGDLLSVYGVLLVQWYIRGNGEHQGSFLNLDFMSSSHFPANSVSSSHGSSVEHIPVRQNNETYSDRVGVGED